MRKILALAICLAGLFCIREGAQTPTAGSAIGNPQIVAKIDLIGQTANVGSTLLFTVPSGTAGLYRYCVYTVITTAAATSSTLPNATLIWTDNDSNTAVNVSGPPLVNLSSGVNAIGTIGGLGSAPVANCVMFEPRPGTAINFGTANYASNLANTMAYAVHGRLEFLGF